MKAPAVKEVLDFDHPEFESLDEPKTAEAKEFKNKRSATGLHALLLLLNECVHIFNIYVL